MEKKKGQNPILNYELKNLHSVFGICNCNIMHNHWMGGQTMNPRTNALMKEWEAPLQRVSKQLIIKTSFKHKAFVGHAYQGKDIVFRFIIEYSRLRDFGP